MLTEKEKQHVRAVLGDLLSDPLVLEMKNYIQHGDVTTYDHCLSVAYRCYEIVLRRGYRVREEELLRAAMLHDFYLYDWHTVGDGSHRLHGFRHARRAAENAVRYLGVSAREGAAIDSHMWPLNPGRFPRTKEGWILTLADKEVSLFETLAGKRAEREKRKRKKPVPAAVPARKIQK